MNEKPNESPAYFAIIPAEVRYCKDLPANAKLLYGEITALCNKYGYCWASNEYFAGLYNKRIDTISTWINSLKKFKFVEIELTQTQKGYQRKIKLITLGTRDFSKVPESVDPECAHAKNPKCAHEKKRVGTRDFSKDNKVNSTHEYYTVNNSLSGPNGTDKTHVKFCPKCAKKTGKKYELDFNERSEVFKCPVCKMQYNESMKQIKKQTDPRVSELRIFFQENHPDKKYTINNAQTATIFKNMLKDFAEIGLNSESVNIIKNRILNYFKSDYPMQANFSIAMFYKTHNDYSNGPKKENQKQGANQHVQRPANNGRGGFGYYDPDRSISDEELAKLEAKSIKL